MVFNGFAPFKIIFLLDHTNGTIFFLISIPIDCVAYIVMFLKQTQITIKVLYIINASIFNIEGQQSPF